MRDRIFEGFLQYQFEQGTKLASESDLLELIPGPGQPPNRYLARFHCRGLVRLENGEISEADRFEVGISFLRDYLRRCDPFQVLTWLGPPNVFHPNIAERGAAICVGRLAPGTGIVDLLYQVFEIITYNKVTMREDDALHRAACAWARRNQHRFPIDRRPLKKRAAALRIDVTPEDEVTARDGVQ
jgi:hypothetical protein